MSRPAPRVAAVLVVFLLGLHAHVTLAPGWVVPAPAVVLAAGVVAAAGLGWLAFRLAAGFRSSPCWRTVGGAR